MAISNTVPATPIPLGWHLCLWAVQIFLAVFFTFAGVMHVTMSPALLIANGVVWAGVAPIALIRFVGGLELIGVLGISLPALTRIQPGLTPLTALGFAAIQALAVPPHLHRGEFGMLPLDLAIVVLSLFVFWGRTRKAFISPR